MSTCHPVTAPHHHHVNPCINLKVLRIEFHTLGHQLLFILVAKPTPSEEIFNTYGET